jgi:hypothetical protein
LRNAQGPCSRPAFYPTYLRRTVAAYGWRRSFYRFFYHILR